MKERKKEEKGNEAAKLRSNLEVGWILTKAKEKDRVGGGTVKKERGGGDEKTTTTRNDGKQERKKNKKRNGSRESN